MALNPWKAPQDIIELVKHLKLKDHSPRLENSSITVCFDDTKPFIKNKINLGKIVKFSPFTKLWQNERHDFCLIIPASLWSDVLKDDQKKAYLDLQLTRCEVEYEPEVIEENGKKKTIKDEWGRIKYTETMKTDDEGNPKWKVLPVDLEVLTKNVRRYGLWLEVMFEFKDAIDQSTNGTHE